jgi:hypothetical protein
MGNGFARHGRCYCLLADIEVRIRVYDCIPADVGYCRCFCCYSLLSVLPPMSMRLARFVLLSELDAAGNADALEIPLLLSSDAVVGDVELDQRPLGDNDSSQLQVHTS